MTAAKRAGSPSPVYRTPGVRDLAGPARPVSRTDRLVRGPASGGYRDRGAVVVALAALGLARRGMAAVAGLPVLQVARPAWFARLVSDPARCRWRWWFYRRRSAACRHDQPRLALLPRPGRRPGPRQGPGAGCTDLVHVALVSGQSPARLRRAGGGIAHGFPGAPVPGPLSQAGRGRAGAGAPGRARRPDARAPDPGRHRPAGTARRQAGGRCPVRGPAGRTRCATRTAAHPRSDAGHLTLEKSRPEVNRRWTGHRLRARRAPAIRHQAAARGPPYPSPRVLVAILRDARPSTFGVAPDGRIFGSDRGASRRLNRDQRVWAEARTLALTPVQVVSPLAGRPYDLRHAAVSLWLNAGVPATQIAERAGRSVEVLLRVYAKCIDGGDKIANTRIEAALRNALNALGHDTSDANSGARPGPNARPRAAIHPTYIPRPAASGGIGRLPAATWLHSPDTRCRRRGIPELVFYVVAGVGFEPT